MGKMHVKSFFRDKQKNQFNKRQRKEVFDWIKQTALALLNEKDCHYKASTKCCVAYGSKSMARKEQLY